MKNNLSSQLKEMANISILIPTYKRPKFIIEAVQSCLLQTYSPYEIIIGDDSPDQLTATEIEKISKTSLVPIKYLHNRPSLGQVGNVNMLLRTAIGDKIMLLHDDDLLMPNALEVLLDCFIKDPTISVSYGKQYIIDSTGTIHTKRSAGYNKSFYRTEKYEGTILTSLEAGIVQQFPNNAYLINTVLAKRIGYSEVGSACDFDFGLRVGQTEEKIYYLNKYTAKYRISAEAVSTDPLCDNALVAYLMVKKVSVPEASNELKIKWLKERSGVAVGQAIANKQFNLAREIFFSNHHLNKIFTLGGVKRLLTLILMQILSTKSKNLLIKKINE